MQTEAPTSAVKVAETDAHEGPVYAPDEHALYFTSVRAEHVAIKRLDLAGGDVSLLVEDANTANGMALDREGRLIVCEQGTLVEPACITRVDRATRAREVLVSGLSSPNDVVVRSDGTIWFTDPSYGWLQGFRPRPATRDRVYRYDPTSGEVAVASECFDKPNGIAFSPDERVLYVGDSGAIHAPGDYDAGRPRRVVAFDVVDGDVRDERVFADEIPGYPDGLKTDSGGRVYVSCAEGVLVYAPDGRLLRLIELPGAVNFAFGPEERALYVTADTAVWAVDLEEE